MKIMKLRFLSILLLTLLARAALADAPPISVAVFDFTSPLKARFSNATGIAGSLVMADLSSNPQFELVDRAELNKLLKEQALGLSGNVDPETAAKIGQLVGAKILVTGQIFSTDMDGQDNVLIVANIIGTETGRIFAQREQGPRADLVRLADDLSNRISQTITNQYTNLVAPETVSMTQEIQNMIARLPGKPRPAVSVQIKEQFLSIKKSGHDSPAELGIIFKQAGFEVVDEDSDKRPDLLVTGSAMSADNGRGTDGLFSVSANLNVKVQERLGGKILYIDSQDGIGVDLNKRTACAKALRNAADKLALKMVPALCNDDINSQNTK